MEKDLRGENLFYAKWTLSCKPPFLNNFFWICIDSLVVILNELSEKFILVILNPRQNQVQNPRKNQNVSPCQIFMMSSHCYGIENFTVSVIPSICIYLNSCFNFPFLFACTCIWDGKCFFFQFRFFSIISPFRLIFVSHPVFGALRLLSS